MVEKLPIREAASMLASCQVLLDALGRPDFYFMEPSEAEEYEA
jgi:hypothetical protein